MIWTAAISGPWSVKLMILIILDPGVCQNHRPGLWEVTISEGVTTTALCGHYQLWTQRTWRKSPPTLCSSLKPASAVFKGANVSPSLILNRHFYISLDQIFLDQAWADGYRVITMQYLPLARLQMEPYGVAEVGGQSDGGILQLFSAQLSFLRRGSKCNMFPWEVFLFSFCNCC